MLKQLTMLSLLVLTAQASGQQDDTIVETPPELLTPAPPSETPGSTTPPPATQAQPANAPSPAPHSADAATPPAASAANPSVGSRNWPAPLTTTTPGLPNLTPKQDSSPQPGDSTARGGATTLTEKDQHVVSQSRMFSVSGGDSLRMGAIATRADEIRAQLLTMLGMDNRWRYAISIRLLGQYTDSPVRTPIRVRMRIIDNEPNFQIRIHSGGGIDLKLLNKAIISMVLYEYSLRELSGKQMPDAVQMPEWLINGLYEAILCRTGKADRRVYQNLFNRAEVLTLESIIGSEHPEKLDTASRQLYDVSCGVLVLALINRPGGQGQLRELIRAAALAEGSPKELISQFFVELGVDHKLLTQWWALELAAFASPRGNELLTPLESDKALSDALTLQYFDPYTGKVRPIALDDAYKISELEDWKNQCRPNLEQLLDLSQRCFPGYNIIVTEYIRAIHELLSGTDPDEVQNILGPMQDLRLSYMKTATRARDYLDWYEISTGIAADGASRNFDAYMQTMRILRQEIPGPDSHISRYLEDIETLYTLKASEDLPEHLRPKQTQHATQN